MTLTDCKHEGYNAAQPFVLSQVCKLCHRYAKVKNFTDYVSLKTLVRCPECHKPVVAREDGITVAHHLSGINACEGTGLAGQNFILPNFER